MTNKKCPKCQSDNTNSKKDDNKTVFTCNSCQFWCFSDNYNHFNDKYKAYRQ